MTDETDEGSLRGLRAVTSRANERGRLLPRPAWVGAASEGAEAEAKADGDADPPAEANGDADPPAEAAKEELPAEGAAVPAPA